MISEPRRIAIVGIGYVGLVSGACFADLGNDVVCLDIDRERIRRLQAGTLPFDEPGLQQLVDRNAAAGRLRFSDAYATAMQGRELVFICVDTPGAADGGMDTSHVEDAVSRSADALADGGSPVIVLKSTVPPGTFQRVTELLADRTGDGVAPSVVVNPEFLSESSAVRDFMTPARAVIGATDSAAAAAVAALYASLDCPVLLMDPPTAELVKLAANCFLATKVSFINEISLLCERSGADVTRLSDAIGSDPRIGRQFLNAGIGFGGGCLPKDLSGLIGFADSIKEPALLLRAARAVNEQMPERIVQRLERSLGGPLAGATVAVLGLAFKPDTDDTRGSQALPLIALLLGRGARVHAWDPSEKVRHAVALALPRVRYFADRELAAIGAAAVIDTGDGLPMLFPDQPVLRLSLADVYNAGG